MLNHPYLDTVAVVFIIAAALSVDSFFKHRSIFKLDKEAREQRERYRLIALDEARKRERGELD